MKGWKVFWKGSSGGKLVYSLSQNCWDTLPSSCPPNVGASGGKLVYSLSQNCWDTLPSSCPPNVGASGGKLVYSLSQNCWDTLPSSCPPNVGASGGKLVYSLSQNCWDTAVFLPSKCWCFLIPQLLRPRSKGWKVFTVVSSFIGGVLARREAPWVKKFGYLWIQEILVVTKSSVRSTYVRPPLHRSRIEFCISSTRAFRR